MWNLVRVWVGVGTRCCTVYMRIHCIEIHQNKVFRLFSKFSHRRHAKMSLAMGEIGKAQKCIVHTKHCCRWGSRFKELLCCCAWWGAGIAKRVRTVSCLAAGLRVCLKGILDVVFGRFSELRQRGNIWASNRLALHWFRYHPFIHFFDLHPGCCTWLLPP